MLRYSEKKAILSFHDSDPDVNVINLLQKLRVKTLVMHGTEDKLVALAASHYLANEIDGATLYHFEGAGHLPTWTATEEFCLQMRDFLNVKPLGVTSAGIAEWTASAE